MDQSPAATALRLAVNKRALISAVRTGDTITVVDLLDRGVPVDTKDDKGKSLLHWAAEGGHVTTMRLLIRRGCDVDSADGRGLTPLHWAAAMGRTKAVRELIRMGATKSVVAGNFGTPLHQAAVGGYLETFVAMVEEGCPTDVNSDGFTVLHFAAQGGHVEVVRELVGRGCDVNAVAVNGCTPLHVAAGFGRTEAVCELIKLGATKSVVAGVYGTPLHQAVIEGHVDAVKALLEDESCEADLSRYNVAASWSKVSENSILGTCNLAGQTPIMWAARYGQVEVFKLLTAKGGAITDRDTHSLSTLEHCFVGGHASKLSQFCEACGIGSSGEGLRGTLATLITKGLVDAHKVLCLCAISGDCILLDSECLDLLSFDHCRLPSTMRCAKYYFCDSEYVSFLDHLRISDKSALNPLQLSLLSKCLKVGSAIGSVTHGTKDHTSFITKLLSHPVLKGTVNEPFPNGLSPLDLARQFELHGIAALIERAGGRPGVWVDLPQNVSLGYYTEPFTLYISLMVCDPSLGGHESVKKAMLEFLCGHPVYSVANKQALFLTVATGDTDTVVDLLDRGVPIDTNDIKGKSLLHWAAEGGHVTTMRLLIRRGCDADSVDGRGLTPLHWAAAMGQTKAVRELIRNGATKSVVARTFGTPLHQAAINGHVETVEAMLVKGCPTDPVTSDGSTVLHFAAQGGHVEVVRELVGRGCDVNAVAVNGCTPLHDAAGWGKTEAVHELIKLGASKSVVASTFGTPLHQAAINGHVETVVAMLEEGCPIDIMNSVGATVLHFAAEDGHVEVVRELVGRGCDVNAVKANGCTPLHDAAGFGRTEAARELIRLGATSSVVAGNYGTPLHQAALKGHVETVVAMLEEGCPIDVMNSVGATVLHFAAEDGHVEVVRELVSRGCDVNAVDADGCTPLHSAAGRGRTEAVHELIRLGASKSMVAGNFGTPLHQAALNGHVETVEAMLAEGCPTDPVTSDGSTVLHFAAQGGHVEVVRELVDRGCDVNAFKANGCTPLHNAAGCGRTEAVHELIRLGASKSMAAGIYGTPLHQAAIWGHLNTIEALLKDDVSEAELNFHDVASSKEQTDCNLISICDSVGETPVVYALRYGQVEVFELLTSKGGAITDRDTHSVSTFEQCFSGGQTSKLGQFCEACGIGSSGEGLRGALATLISCGLVDAHKVLCLCAISGDSVFLEEQFIELLASDDCALPGAMKFAKYLFSQGITFLNQLGIPDETALNPLHMSLLSLKCFDMGLVDAGFAVKYGVKDQSSFISKLLSHPVMKETVNEHFPNGLSPLDLARQFELHDIAALIEGAGGRPGVWADVPQDVFLRYCSELFTISSSLKKVCDPSQGGHEAVRMAVIKLLGVQTVVHAADDSQLLKEQILGQRPGLKDLVTLVLPHIQWRHWKRVGLALDIEKSTLDGLGQQFSNDDDRYLETLSYWLEHGSSVTWKTMLDVLSLSEAECTMVELRGKIVSELGGAHQVSVQCCVLSEGALWCVVWRRQVLLSCHVCLCLCCLLLPSCRR